MMDKDDIYASGFIDGEGCIGIFTCNVYRYCKIEVTQTQRDVLLWLQGLYGGVVNECKRKKVNPYASPSWRWVLQGVRCRDVLNRIRPYARVKRKEIDMVLEFLATKYPEPSPSRAKQEKLAELRHLIANVKPKQVTLRQPTIPLENPKFKVINGVTYRLP